MDCKKIARTAIGSDLVGEGTVEVSSAVTLDRSGPDQVSFLANPRGSWRGRGRRRSLLRLWWPGRLVERLMGDSGSAAGVCIALALIPATRATPAAIPQEMSGVTVAPARFPRTQS